MEYTMISDYLDKDKYRHSYNKLAISTFSLDFEKWYKKELFYNRYICYSYIKEDEVIANVSINKMNLVVEGENKKAIQLGTVMTHPEYRNNGLSSSLIKHIIEKYENDQDIIYLFANDSVLDFYPKFGFEKVIESAYELDTSQLQRQEISIRKLNIENKADYKLVLRLATNRRPISQNLGVHKDIWPLLAYCFFEYNEDLDYLEDEDIIVISKRKEGILHIYDVLSLKPFELDKVLEKISMSTDRKLEFHFIPELRKYKANTSLMEKADDTLFIRSKNTLLKEVLFPLTSHT